MGHAQTSQHAHRTSWNQYKALQFTVSLRPDEVQYCLDENLSTIPTGVLLKESTY